MNSPEASWVAQRRDSYPGCQPLKDTRAWASFLKMDPAGLEGGPCDAPCDEPLIRAAWNLSGDTLSSLLCWRGAVIVYVKVTAQTKDSNKLLSLLYW
ncbi:putative protein ATP11AUN [Macaca thibetana thibetana]|uniref:putative protein ATP11AUN n=1 Tax=Macaca thibetana thibetana TaxID=257877 RepID=UPI0021BC918B|nr:putative protein ATP11AUN [Macaca thibetana thibetana]